MPRHAIPETLTLHECIHILGALNLEVQILLFLLRFWTIHFPEKYAAESSWLPVQPEFGLSGRLPWQPTSHAGQLLDFQGDCTSGKLDQAGLVLGFQGGCSSSELLANI